MTYTTRRARIEAEKRHRRGRHMRSMTVGMAGFATVAGAAVAGVAPAHADHTVQSGDTLSEIAAQNADVSVSDLKQANGLSSSLIYPGQTLSFSSSSSADSSSSSSRSSSSSSSNTYTVVSGDTLGTIAAQHGTSVSALMDANGLSSTLIYPGEQLSVSGGSSSSSDGGNSSGSSSSSNSSSSGGSSDSSSASVTTASSSTSSTSSSSASWAKSTANSSSSYYSWGGNGPGYDCSGFSKSALAQDGKQIARSSAAQYAGAQSITKGQLQAGDLVFYGNGGVSHVAVYVGDGQIAHARNYSAGITVNSLDTYSQYNNVIGYGRY